MQEHAGIRGDADAPAGLLAEWAAARGVQLEVARLDRGELVAEGIAAFDRVVTLGSAQAADDDAVAWQAVEQATLRAAAEAEVPILGICRGMQVMNVARGGTLQQHLPEVVGHNDHRRTPGSFDDADHDVRLQEGSLAARAAGEELHGTKSHHHQAVDRVAEAFEVTGWSSIDELPEAFEAPDRRFALGVQWHPEADERSRLIGALVAEAAAARNGSR